MAGRNEEQETTKKQAELITGRDNRGMQNCTGSEDNGRQK
jgi:hypothetical protein